MGARSCWEPGAGRRVGAARAECSLICSVNKKRRLEWVSGGQSSSYVVVPETDEICSMGVVAVFALMLLLAHPSHDVDVFLCPRVSFNLGILSVLRKVNYTGGVDLQPHFLM